MDILPLAQAVQSLNADDAWRVRLNADQWHVLAQYLTRHEIQPGDLLVKQGDTDRTVYLLEQGTMQVFATGSAPAGHRLAILRPGAVIGEPGLFGEATRMANVEAMTRCVIWALRGPRFEELAQRVPALAIELLRSLGGVMAARMRANLARQVPVT
jgi:CRP-like cAMP-binding protein